MQEIKMTGEQETAFETLVQELAADPRTLKMREFIQHGMISTYDHCMNVAKLAFVLNQKWHLHADERHLVMAAFLHDYYLYDWHGYGDHLHGYHHPKRAAENAKRDFAIPHDVQKAIESHMWPLTLFHVPSSRVAWLVTIADKICSSQETLFERRVQTV